VERSLADTCLGMRKYGLIQRIGRGTYIAGTEQEVVFLQPAGKYQRPP